MPEKKAKGFAHAGEESFKLGKKPKDAAKEHERKLMLEIVDVPGKKVLLRKKEVKLKLTGNPLIDTFRRINEFIVDHQKVKVKEKAVFFRLLSVMLNAGLALVKSLDTLGVQSEKNPKLAKILFEMARSIEGGQSLSESMSIYPEVFGDAEIGVVKAGEAGGQLNKTLKALAVDLEKTASITGKIKGAMIYPIVILSLLGVAIFLMMIMVVPQITRLFTSMGQDLPLPTRILIAASNFSVNYWYLVILGVIGIGVLFSVFKKSRNGRYILDMVKLRLPIFGQIIQKGVLSKFSRGLSNLLSSGVPIIKSIEIVGHAVGNEVYKRRLILTAEDMKRGIPMAENMSGSKLFPKMLVNMIEIGEQTAQIENVTIKIAEFYDEEIDVIVKGLSKIMEPLILVIIGVTVGGLVAAIMLPIMQLTETAGTM